MTPIKHILRPSAVRDIFSRFDTFTKATYLLTLQYSLLVFVLLAIVSSIIYVLFLFQTGVIIGDGPLVGVFTDDSASHEAGEKLLSIIFFVSGTVWVVASIFSYFLARKTLQPIRQMYASQERFVADVAHELRTPLSVLKLGSETLLKQHAHIDEYKTFIKDTSKETNRLIRLTNDLLSLASYSFVSPSQWQTVDFSQLVTQQAQAMKVYADKKHITITHVIDKNIYVRGLEPDLIRMVTNVLRNAIDYSHPDDTVTVRLQQKLSSARLTITDTGIGIAKKDLPHIFKRFYKADNARTHTEDASGGGLGLFIVKEIIERHRGNISVMSTEQKGTTLHITIPCV